MYLEVATFPNISSKWVGFKCEFSPRIKFGIAITAINFMHASHYTILLKGEGLPLESLSLSRFLCGKVQFRVKRENYGKLSNNKHSCFYLQGIQIHANSSTSKIKLIVVQQKTNGLLFPILKAVNHHLFPEMLLTIKNEIKSTDMRKKNKIKIRASSLWVLMFFDAGYHGSRIYKKKHQAHKVQSKCTGYP